MLKKSLWFLPPTLLGILILFTSIFRTSSIKYQFEPSPKPAVAFANASFISPNTPLWPVVVAQEKVDLALTFDSIDKAEKLLGIADKRLRMAVTLFEQGNSEVGYSVLTKAEKYLELAANSEHALRQEGLNTYEFLHTLSFATQIHIDTIENIQKLSPETARPLIVLTSNYPKRLQQELKIILLSQAPAVNTF